MTFLTKAALSALLFLTMTLTGCMRHKTHDKNVKAEILFGDTADFDLEGVRGIIQQNKVDFQNIRGWRIPLYQPYQFTARITDANSLRSSLRDFKFAVLDEDGQPICQLPVALGGEPKCEYTVSPASEIVWEEKILYDHFKADAEPVRVIRKIKGLGAKRGTRTAVLELNPWAPSRNQPNAFIDRTIELSSDQAQTLVVPTYRSEIMFRYADQNDASELVIRDIVRQTYLSTQPILVERSDPDLKKLETKFGFENLVFSKYAPTEFVRLRQEAQALQGLDFKSTSLEPLSELIQGTNRIYVYRDKSENLENIDGLRFDLTLLMKLGFRYPNLIDGVGISEISAGRFRVHAHLVLEPATRSQPVLLTPGINPLVSEIARNNDLQLDYKAIIPFYPSAGMIKLAVKIYPLGVTEGLKPLDRLFTVGTFNDLIGRNGGLIEDEDSRNNIFDFDEYIKASIDGENAYQQGYVDKARDFELEDLSIRFSTVEAGETAAQRTVIFRVDTKAFDETSNTPVGDNVSFEVVSLHTDYNTPTDKSKWKFYTITDAKNPEDPSRVRPGGRITWYDTITHKYYQTEELVERDIFISKWRPGLDLRKKVKDWAISAEGIPDDKLLPAGIQKLKIYINPWDEKFGTFGQDARIASESFLKKVRGREKIQPRFFIGDYGYETLRFRYKIDKDMKLNVKKTVLLSMMPKVLRYSSILEGINSIYNLRDGIYLMKTAIQKDYLDPSARNESDILQIPFELDGEFSNLPSQEFNPEDFKNIPDIDIEAPNGDSQVFYGGKPVTDQFIDGLPNRSAVSIPVENPISVDGSISYTDPRRKRAMSMVKKLVRVNAGRVITPVEFSVEDLRLMRIRQQFFVQLEPVNQVRLQMVNLIKERFEQIFQIKLGEKSPILAKMTPQEEARLKSLMTRALDAVAEAVSDDVYISKLEDLENIINHPKVSESFQAFERSQFRGQNLDLRLKDILREIKTDKDEAAILNISGEDVEQRLDQIEQNKKDLRKEHDQALNTLDEISELNEKTRDSLTVQMRQCRELSPVTVHYDESQKTESSTDRIDAVTKALIPFETNIFEDNYADNVSKFQPLGNNGDQFFESLINQSTLNQMLKNDFTITPAFSAVSNLDMLIDKKSGIKGRTFVGPMTFLYNTNKGSLRPTDNLDEAYCESDDCNSLNTSIDSQYGEIQNYEYEKSPYHGSIAHFLNVTFSDQEFVDQRTGLRTKIKGLETMFQELQSERKAYRKVEGLLTRFLDYFDMSYVSLTDRPLDRLVCRDDIASNKCFRKDTEKTVLVDDFLSQYSDTVNKLVNLDYSPNQPVELKFQNIVGSPRNGFSSDRLLDHKNISELTIPWGFVSPVFNKDLERCVSDIPELDSLCSSANEKKRLGGLIRSKFDVEVAYAEPTKNELRDIIRYQFSGNEMVSAKAAKFDIGVQSKMCDLLIYGEIAKNAKKLVVTEADKLQLRRDLFDMSLRCQTDIKNGLEPVVIERKFRIFETGRYYFLGGKSMNINASQDVRVSSGLRVARNFGARPLRLITGIIEKGTNFISKTLSLVVGSFDFSYSMQRDRGFIESTGISKGTYLVMQNAEFEVELTNYEQCLTVRWSPDLLKSIVKILVYRWKIF